MDSHSFTHTYGYKQVCVYVGQQTYALRVKSALVNERVPCVWHSSGALEILKITVTNRRLLAGYLMTVLRWLSRRDRCSCLHVGDYDVWRETLSRGKQQRSDSSARGRCSSAAASRVSSLPLSHHVHLLEIRPKFKATVLRSRSAHSVSAYTSVTLIATNSYESTTAYTPY